MSQDFQSQLEALINEAVKGQLYNFYKQPTDMSSALLIEQQFKQGCDLLMPVLMRAIEQKDFYLKDARDEYDQKLAKETDNKELLNILKGEK